MLRSSGQHMIVERAVRPRAASSFASRGPSGQAVHHAGDEERTIRLAASWEFPGMGFVPGCVPDHGSAVGTSVAASGDGVITA